MSFSLYELNTVFYTFYKYLFCVFDPIIIEFDTISAVPNSIVNKALYILLIVIHGLLIVIPRTMLFTFWILTAMLYHCFVYI